MCRVPPPATTMQHGSEPGFTSTPLSLATSLQKREVHRLRESVHSLILLVTEAIRILSFHSPRFFSRYSSPGQIITIEIDYE